MPSLLSLGARAMLANQAALQTIGQNISNANTPGYSRQSVLLANSQGQFTGAGFFGRGVDVQTVVRSHNDFLTRQAIATKAVASADQTRADQLSRIEKLFPTGENGIGLGKRKYLPLEHGDVAVDVMRAVKAALDSRNLLNPGKILPSG